ncbi:hypothetical protein MXB_2783 [Myxobolus squamalis]|nr:hypothetical protein MXB_2783 [Myxobolus squamalis]
MHRNPYSIETAIFGPGGVGKSCLTLRYLFDEFVEEYEPTKCDAFRKTLKIDDKVIEMSILDTAGQEDYEFVRDNFIRSSSGFFCTYSIVDEQSFEALDDILDKIFQIKNRDEIAVLLVGNKQDLVLEDDKKRAVSETMAAAKALKYNINYMEVSAKSNFNVKEMFEYIAEGLAKKITVEPELKKKKKQKRKWIKCTIL